MLLSKAKGRRPANQILSGAAIAAVEHMESRVFLSATITTQPVGTNNTSNAATYQVGAATSFTPSAASSKSGVVSLTFTGATPTWGVGQSIVVSGFVPGTYNGTVAVKSNTGGVVTYTSAATGTVTTFGSVTEPFYTFTAVASDTTANTAVWQTSTDNGATWSTATTGTATTTSLGAVATSTYKIPFPSKETDALEYRAEFTNPSTSAKTDTNGAYTVVVGTPISQWIFTTGEASSPGGNSAPGTANHPSPTLSANSSDFAITLGLNNDYTGVQSFPEADIHAKASGVNSSFVPYMWRVRGGNGGGPTGSPGSPEGWSQNAPQYAQGVEFGVNTVGYSNVTVGFQWTSGGINDMQAQYTSDVTAGSPTWTNVGSLIVAQPDYFSNPTIGKTIIPTGVLVNLQGIAAASNNANFGIRFVAAYDPALPQINDGNLAVAEPHGQYSTGTPGAVNDKQFITLGDGQQQNTVSGGSFTLTFNNPLSGGGGSQTTGAIAYSSNTATMATNIQNALASLTNIPAGDVSVAPYTGDVTQTRYQVTFLGATFGQLLTTSASTLQINTSNLTGSAASSSMVMTWVYGANGTTNLGATRYVDGGGAWELGNFSFNGDTISKAPGLLTQPASTTVVEGATATFTSKAYSDTTITGVQWQYSADGTNYSNLTNGQIVNGAASGVVITTSADKTTSTLQFPTTNDLSESGYKFRVQYSDATNTQTSNPATLTVVVPSPPVVTIQPDDYSQVVNSDALFFAAATGAPTPTVQWQMNTGSGWSNVPANEVGYAGNNGYLTVPTTSTSQTGTQYRAAFSGAGQTVFSNVVTLTVLASETPIATWDFSGGTLFPTGFTESGSTVTVTTQNALIAGQSVTIVNAPTSGYNGNYTVLSATPTTFTYTDATTGLGNVAAPALPGGDGSVFINPYLPTAISESGTTVTVTDVNGFYGDVKLGSVIIIAGVTPAGYNGTFTVTSATQTSFTYTNTVSGLASVTAGNYGTATPQGFVNSPKPVIGSGTASAIGLTLQDYSQDPASGDHVNNFGAYNTDDVKNETGETSLDASFSANFWRLRSSDEDPSVVGGNTAEKGQGTIPAAGTPSNGWSNLAPQYTQGAQFAVNTTGYNSVYVSMYWYSTQSGIRDMQRQYSLDGGSTWTNLGGLLEANPIEDTYGGSIAGAPVPVVYNLTGVSGAANNPNLEIRAVSAYNPYLPQVTSPVYNTPYDGSTTTTTHGQYANGAINNIADPTTTVPYNGSKGNWQFADIAFQGIPLLPAWLAPNSIASYNASTHTLTVTGAATIIADPGTDLPNIVASGSAAKLAIQPATSPSDIHLGGITLTNGASINVTSVTGRSHSNHNVVVIGTLNSANDPTFSIDSTSVLDLQDNDLIVHTGTSDTSETNFSGQLGVQALVGTGREGGNWDGLGLTSTAAQNQDNADGQESVQLAPVLNLDLPDTLASYSVGTKTEALGANDIIVKYTYTGDFNIDGQVSRPDASIFSNDYDNGRSSGNEWALGDTNSDGKINRVDASIFSNDYGHGTGSGSVDAVQL